jgi:hypothetical protein
VREGQRVIERLPLRDDVLEVGQGLEVGAQVAGIEPGLEPRLAEPLRLVMAAGGEERRDPGPVPIVGTRSTQGEGPLVIVEVSGGRLGRRTLLQEGERLLGTPGGEQAGRDRGRPRGDRRPVSCSMNASTSPSWSAMSCRARRSASALRS